MFRKFTTLLIVFYLPSTSMIPVSIYENARFNLIDNHSMFANLSSVISQKACICQCFTYSMCITAMYNGLNQYCVLYSAQLQDGNLQLITTDSISSVISIRNMISQDPTIPSMAATEATSTRASTQLISHADTTIIQTSSSSTMSTMITTLTSTAIITTAVATCTTFVTFDDIPGQLNTSGVIPNGYKNLNWINAEYINTLSTPTNSGYRTGVRSPPFVAHNPNGDNMTITTANGTRFSFDSLRLSSAWRSPLNITMKTNRAGSTISIGIYSATTTSRIFVFCNFCTNIDTITLHAEDVTHSGNSTQNGTQFILDDLCISFGH